MEYPLLVTIIILIATIVFVVAIFKRLALSPALGYLAAGAVIGDNGLRIITYDNISFLGELGVVFLLFVIGLDLSFKRLKAMRLYVFGLGSLQVLVTGVVIAIVIFAFKGYQNSVIIIAGGLALSSTAIVMQIITDGSKNHSNQVSRIAVAILLLQDVVVVPLLVIVPLLGGAVGSESLALLLMKALGKAVVALTIILITGVVLLRPLFKFIASVSSHENNELPIAVTLLVVFAASWITEHFGLSLALGAFISGVLVAETNFRRKAEESIMPFKSLLLGLFFISVGMKIDVVEIYLHINQLIIWCISLIVLKTIIITSLCILFGFNLGVALHTGLLLSQGGEFAFILFELAKSYRVLDIALANLLLTLVTCSMALTPLLVLIGQKFSNKIEQRLGKSPIQIIEYGARDLTNHVIIAGFGKVGTMLARVLNTEGINYIALDTNDEIVREEVSNGLAVFKGDTSNVSILKAVGAGRAITIVLTMNNITVIKKAIKVIHSHFENLKIVVKLKDLKNAPEFFSAGVSHVVPQDYEVGLQLGATILKSFGINEYEINSIKNQFRAGNYIGMKEEDDLFEQEEKEE